MSGRLVDVWLICARKIVLGQIVYKQHTLGCCPMGGEAGWALLWVLRETLSQ